MSMPSTAMCCRAVNHSTDGGGTSSTQYARSAGFFTLRRCGGAQLRRPHFRDALLARRVDLESGAEGRDLEQALNLSRHPAQRELPLGLLGELARDQQRAKPGAR